MGIGVRSIPFGFPLDDAISKQALVAIGDRQLGFISVVMSSGEEVNQWNTAYSDRFKWDGGSEDLNVTTARTSLYLDSNSIPTFSGIILSLGYTRIPYINSSGQFVDSPNLTFNNNLLQIDGNVAISGTMYINSQIGYLSNTVNNSSIIIQTKNTVGTVYDFTFDPNGVFIGKSSFRVLKDGSDSVAAGANFYLANAANNRGWVTQQLTASNHLDMWYYDGASWVQKFRFTNDGKLGIGTTSPSYPLHVVGNQYLQSGNLGIGATPYTYGATGNEHILEISRTFTDYTASSEKVGSFNQIYWNPTGSGGVVHYIAGLVGNVSVSNTATVGVAGAGYLAGMSFAVFNRANVSVPYIYGNRIQVGTYNGTGGDSTGTVTNVIGNYIIGHKTASSTITNAYGVYITGMQGTNVYDIYASDSGAKNYFAGNVGIGTTGPDRRLNIVGTFGGGAGDSAYHGIVRIDDATALAADNGGGVTFGYTYTGSTQTYGPFIRGYKSTATDGQVGGGLKFGVRGDAGNPFTAMTIDKAGNVGIGTTRPTGPLEVVHQGGNIYPIYLTAYASSNALPGFVGRSARGTLASPTATQSGDYMFIAAARGFTTVWQNSSSALIGMNAAENFSNGHLGAYMTFETTPIGSVTRAERMRILDNGNVGIGTTSPYYKLYINGDLGFVPGSSVVPSNNGDVVVEATNDTTITLKLKGSDGTIRSSILTLS